MEEAGVIEIRNTQDTPLSERDCEIFTDFYFGFLGKSEEEKVNLLKGLTLLRQGQRRQFIHSVINNRGLAENLFPTLEERELLLTFPSTLQMLWQVIIEYRQNFGELEEAVASMRNWTIERLGEIQKSRDELNRILEPLRPVPPKDKFELSMTFASTGSLKQRAQVNYKLLLVILSSRPFICIIPEKSPSTMALGKLRSYIDRTLGSAPQNVPIEFFTVGGGHLNKSDKILIGGKSEIFDPVFEDPTATSSSKVADQYRNTKFNLLREVLKEEFPTEVFDWEIEVG
jgi:hypothetical protein